MKIKSSTQIYERDPNTRVKIDVHVKILVLKSKEYLTCYCAMFRIEFELDGTDKGVRKIKLFVKCLVAT